MIPGSVPVTPWVQAGFEPLSRKGRLERTHRIEVITPMFGGVFPGEPDEVTPVRVSSIRGQLRFWWRATVGAECEGTKDLAEREGYIWGTTQQGSRVDLSVEVVSEGVSEACAYRGSSRFPKPVIGFPGYVVFPFQGTKQDPEAKKALKGVVFDLHVSCREEERTDVEKALWAFCNFGGLGARTRRGCGALFCEDFAPSDRVELEERVRKYRQTGDKHHPWPVFFTSLQVKEKGAGKVSEAWLESIELLKDFRQGPNVGRNPGVDAKRPGRSRWPEPETLRKATGKRDSRHKRNEAIPDTGFPRAEFGMPIIFHFQSKSDPSDSELLPYSTGRKDGDKGASRMASPLIIRPFLFKNRQAAAMILRLDTPPLEGVLLKPIGGKAKPQVFGRDSIVNEQFASYPKSPLGSPETGHPARSAKGSALEGFLSFAKERGFREVE